MDVGKYSRIIAALDAATVRFQSDVNVLYLVQMYHICYCKNYVYIFQPVL